MPNGGDIKKKFAKSIVSTIKFIIQNFVRPTDIDKKKVSN